MTNIYSKTYKDHVFPKTKYAYLNTAARSALDSWGTQSEALRRGHFATQLELKLERLGLDYQANYFNLRQSVGRKRIPTSPASPFYGYPAEVIAEWCGVSVGTAEHYKAGRRKPPTPVLRLFRLYRDQKVLGTDWEGYKVHGPKLFGPDGKHITASHIVLQGLLWQALSDSNQDKYFELLRVTDHSQ